MKLQKEGWTFIPITYFSKLRDLSINSNVKLPAHEAIVKQNENILQRVEILPEKVNEVKSLLKRSNRKHKMNFNDNTVSKKAKLN